MDNILFYPTLTDRMIEDSGISVDGYKYKYAYQDKIFDLVAKGHSSVRLSDPLEIWSIESEGLIIEKTIRIAYPDLLKGREGIISSNADLGVCIIWTNKKLTQTGVILPENDELTPQGRICKFLYCFEPGIISGDLELTLSFYVKNEAKIIEPGEEDLVNEAGVNVGEVERVVLDFKSLYMEFPIEEFKSENEPLWWVEFSEWEDPKTIDLFTRDSFCLYLNPHYDECPAPAISGSGNTIKNFDLMVDILAQTYLMMFQRLTEADLNATRQNIGLANNTICSILHQFIEDCSDELHWESPEKLLKSLHVNIRKRLLEEA